RGSQIGFLALKVGLRQLSRGQLGLGRSDQRAQVIDLSQQRRVWLVERVELGIQRYALTLKLRAAAVGGGALLREVLNVLVMRLEQRPLGARLAFDRGDRRAHCVELTLAGLLDFGDRPLLGAQPLELRARLS